MSVSHTRGIRVVDEGQSTVRNLYFMFGILHRYSAENPDCLIHWIDRVAPAARVAKDGEKVVVLAEGIEVIY